MSVLGVVLALVVGYEEFYVSPETGGNLLLEEGEFTEYFFLTDPDAIPLHGGFLVRSAANMPDVPVDFNLTESLPIAAVPMSNNAGWRFRGTIGEDAYASFFCFYLTPETP
jgi:hypothetical protein